uniref:Protein kinase domain-containing protein n=1 Tax=Arcella intermedia TaxID=1963864 RepID=A0A6B2LB45_9EUKA
MSNFEQLELLGDGHMARVYRVRHKTTHMEYALKVQRKSDIVDLKQIEHVRNEKQILSQLDHPFLIKIHRTYVDKRNIYLLQELCKKEFFTVLRYLGSFDLHRARIYAAEIVVAFEHMHSQHIIYRDLKPENLLFGEDGHIKICDFGFAKVVTDRTWTTCGTPDYMAPEIVLGVGHGYAADWWSFGVLLYEMIAGYPPFFAANHFDLYQRICDCEFTFTSPNFDDTTKDLISKLLVEPRRRLGNLAGGAQDIKNHPFFQGIEWGKLVQKLIPAPDLEGIAPMASVKPSLPMEELDLIDLNEDSLIDAYEPIFRDFDMT